MHQRTARLAAEIRSAPLAEQLRILRGAFSGGRCVVLTCGPSLSDVSAVRLRQALRGTLTIAVKQAIAVAGEQADFHCFNAFNVQRYTVPALGTIRCVVQSANRRPVQFNRADMEFVVDATAGNLEHSLAVTGDFESHPLCPHKPRPWGPGIMYEIVLPLAVHLGAAEVITVGWDISNPAGRNTHFYDNSRDRDYYGGTYDDRPQSATLPMRIRRKLATPRSLLAHVRGSVYNRAVTAPGEAEAVARSTGAATAWLKSEGVSLRAVTASTHIAPEVERLTTEGLFELLYS